MNSLAIIINACTPPLQALYMLLLIDLFMQLCRAISAGKVAKKAIITELCIRIAMLALLAVGYQLDALLGSALLSEACIFFYIAHAACSTLDACAALGVPLPPPLVQAVQRLLHKPGDKAGDSEGV